MHSAARCGRLLAVPLILLGLSIARPTRAADFQVEAETIGQGYQLRCFDPSVCPTSGPLNPTLLDRRRLTQYLNLNAFRLLPDEWTGPRRDRNQVYFSASMRFDTDFGSYLTDAPSGENRIRELPRSLSVDQFQLLYAVLGGNDFFGFLDFQLGRQIVFDTMDFYSFDGLEVRVRAPWWFAVEGWAGLEVRNEAPLASPIYELDGTSQGARDPATCLQLAYPMLMRGCPDQSAELAPTFGGAIESWGIHIFHGRLAYRRTFSGTAGHVSGDGLPASGLDEEKLSYTLNASLGRWRPFGGLRYNLLVGGIDEIEGGMRVGLGGGSLLGEYLYNSPTFDGDSIFNVFAIFAYNDARLTYTTPDLGDSRFWLTGFFRTFNDNTEAFHQNGIHGEGATMTVTTPLADSEAYGVAAGWRIKLGLRGHVRLDAYYDDGFGGRRLGGDASGRYILLPDTLDLEGRVTVIDFEPDLQKQNNFQSTSVGVQGGGRYVMTQGVSLHLLVEENSNRIYNSQFRALALLDLTFMR